MTVAQLQTLKARMWNAVILMQFGTSEFTRNKEFGWRTLQSTPAMTVIALIGSYGKQEIYQNLILQAAYLTMELFKSRSKHIQGQMRTLTSKLYLMSARLALDLSLLLFPQA